jgi:hypothetical protein
MKLSQMVIWKFFFGTAFVLSAGQVAYGAGQVSTGHYDSVSLGMLIGGLVVRAVCVLLVMRHYCRHSSPIRRRQTAGAGQGASRPGVTRCRDDCHRMSASTPALGPQPGLFWQRKHSPR